MKGREKGGRETSRGKDFPSVITEGKSEPTFSPLEEKIYRFLLYINIYIYIYI